MNIVRYNAGACSWNEIEGRKMVVSKIIKRYLQMEGFWLDGKNPDPKSPSWDWSVDAKQRALLQKAKERGADRFELFSNMRGRTTSSTIGTVCRSIPSLWPGALCGSSAFHAGGID